MPEAVLPTLQYADLPALWGVSIEQTPSAFRIAVHPTFGWGSVFATYQKAAVVFFVLLVIGVMSVVTQRPIAWEGLAANFLLYGSPLLIIVAIVRARLRQRIVFEVTADRVSCATIRASGRGTTRSWSREQIGYAKLNPYNNQLTLQLIGEDLLQIWISPKREVTEFVANRLDEALRTVTRDPSSREILPPLTPPSRPPFPRVLLAISATMALAGVVVMATDAAIAPLGVYLLLLAAVPIGIAFGTQPKKFWV